MKKSIITICMLSAVCFSEIKAQTKETEVVKIKSFHAIELGFRLMPTFSAFDMRTSAGGDVTG